MTPDQSDKLHQFRAKREGLRLSKLADALHVHAIRSILPQTKST